MVVESPRAVVLPGRRAARFQAEREWVDGRDAHVEDLGRKAQLVFPILFSRWCMMMQEVVHSFC